MSDRFDVSGRGRLLVDAGVVAEFMQSTMRDVEQRLAGGIETFVPSLRVLSKHHNDDQGQVSVSLIDAAFNEEREKRAIFRGIARELFGRQLIPVLAVLASEAWAVTAATMPGCEPRHHPDRQEVIVVSGATIDGKQQPMSLMEVSRKDGLIVPGVFSEATPGESSLVMQLFLSFADIANSAYHAKRN